MKLYALLLIIITVCVYERALNHIIQIILKLNKESEAEYFIPCMPYMSTGSVVVYLLHIFVF